MKSTVRTICFSLLIGCAATLGAQQQQRPIRPVTSAWTVEAGSAMVADTYLSPLRYSGMETAVAYERWQAIRFNPRRAVMQLQIRGSFTRTMSPARNSVMLGLGAEGSWAMLWRKDIAAAPGLTLGAGGEADLRIGALYLPRNGNNPAQAEAAATIGATAFATYSTRLGRLPLTLRWQPSLPLLGAFFCPDYGELYYEISLGNTAGLVHCAWPGAYRRLRSLLTADLRFGATALRLGYRADVISTRANHVTHRAICHMAVIGISTEWMSLSPDRRPSAEAEIISAYY